MLNPRVQKHANGLTVLGSEEGKVRFRVENIEQNQDHLGLLSKGCQLVVLDNAGVFASFGKNKRGGGAATVDLKISFCDQIKDEAGIIYGHCLKLQNRAINNQVMMFGEDSRKLIAFGTMSFWMS